MKKKLDEYLQLKQREGINQSDATIEILQDIKKFTEQGYLDENNNSYEYLKELVVISPQKKKETIYQALRNTLGRRELIQSKEYVEFQMKITEPLVRENDNIFIPHDIYGETAIELALKYENSKINYYEPNNQNAEMVRLLNDVLDTKVNIEDKNFTYESIESKNYYDLAIINPPMGIKLDVESVGVENIVLARKVTSEAASLIKGIETVKEGGYIVCTIPQSFLFSNLNKDIRGLLLKKCDVMLIADAPKKCLLNTNITMSIMVLRKKTSDSNVPKEFIAATFENLSIEDEQFQNEVEELYIMWEAFAKEGK